MKKSKEVTGFSTDSFWYQTLQIANRQLRAEDILFLLTEVGKNPHLQIGKLIRSSLKGGETVVIDDRSHGKVVGIRQFSPRKLEVVEIDRHGRHDFDPKDLRNPQFQAHFTDEGEFSLNISGYRNGEVSKDQYSIFLSSGGPNRPRGFTITTDKEIILARVDLESKDLSLVYEYMHPDKVCWMVGF